VIQTDQLVSSRNRRRGYHMRSSVFAVVSLGGAAACGGKLVVAVGVTDASSGQECIINGHPPPASPLCEPVVVVELEDPSACDIDARSTLSVRDCATLCGLNPADVTNADGGSQCFVSGSTVECGC
jgi:hypothetical protein